MQARSTLDRPLATVCRYLYTSAFSAVVILRQCLVCHDQDFLHIQDMMITCNMNYGAGVAVLTAARITLHAGILNYKIFRILLHATRLEHSTLFYSSAIMLKRVFLTNRVVPSGFRFRSRLTKKIKEITVLC